MCLSKRLFALVFCVLALARVGICQKYIATGAEVAPQRGVYEVRLKASRATANPYFDTRLDVTFTTPTGKNITVEGFFDGARTYKARAYTGETGVWKWNSQSNDPGLDKKSGSFRVGLSDLKGKLRVSSSDRGQFSYDNGDWFLHIGDTGYRYLIPTEANWQQYVDEADESGITKIRAWFAQSRSTVELLFTPDRKSLNLPFWQEMERRLDYALSWHPHVIFELIPYAEDAAEINRYPTDAWSQYIARYAQARWSAFPNVQWTMTNDRPIIRDQPITGTAVAWKTIDMMGKDMAARESWGTLITNHQRRFSGYDFAGATWSNFVTLEDIDQVAGVRILEYRAKDAGPVVLDEDRYELYRNPVNRRYYFRRLMWASLLSGGSATYGGLRTFEPSDDSGARGIAGYYAANRAGLLYQGAHDFIQIHKFFRDSNLTLIGMKPEDALVGGDPSRWKCIHDESNYIVYIANPTGTDPATDNPAVLRATAEVKLPSGRFSVRWFNPRTGVWTKDQEVDGGTQKLSAPALPGMLSSEDWIVLLSVQH